MFEPLWESTGQQIQKSKPIPSTGFSICYQVVHSKGIILSLKSKFIENLDYLLLDYGD